MNNFFVIKATLDDIEDILNICARAVDKMINIDKLDQWNQHYPNQEIFTEDILKNELYIIKTKNKIIGFAALNKELNSAYSHVNWSLDDDFLIIHRFAIDPDFQKQNAASTLHLELEKEAKRAKVSLLRIDTFSQNIAMNNFILKMDYNFVGQIDLKPPKPFWNCYEKNL